MNKPRATTAGENKHTSTEAHMSKVEHIAEVTA
jgi:hypothetical protein